MDQLVTKLLLKTRVCVCVFFYLLHTKNPHLTCKVRTFVGNKDSLAGPHILKGMFEG